MIRVENHCCDCATDGYPCRGRSCPNRAVEVYYCDKCKDEIAEVYEVAEMHFCEECLLEEFRKEI